METPTDLMTWASFREALAQHPDRDLQFQYAENKWVAPSYHITEIKQAPITSVDCGGKLNTWTEIIIQLWEPTAKQQERAMKARKALSIVQLVEKSMHLTPDAIVKIEFGNSLVDTRQMYPSEFVLDGENIIVNLRSDFTQCKAIGRGGSCGTEKPKQELKDLTAEACCIPGGGCC